MLSFFIYLPFILAAIWGVSWGVAHVIRENIREKRRQERELEIANYAHNHKLTLYEARKILYPDDK